MAILIGVHPGGRNKFAVATLYLSDRLPALLVGLKSHSGVDAVLRDMVGTIGEWGELTAAAIDSPMTWSGSANGWRDADTALRKMLPRWAPRTWVRPPNSLSAATAVQGPALGWVLAQEVKQGTLPKHSLLETHSRVSLTGIGRHLPKSVLGVHSRSTKAATRRKHIVRLLESIVDAGILKMECDPPHTPEELSALVCAVTALGAKEADTGIVVDRLEGGEIRPVGRRPIAVLRALP